MSVPLIPYADNYFVDRERAINLVLSKVRKVLNSDKVHLRHTTFYGARGSGKSWLLRHLVHLCEKEFNNAISVIYLLLGREEDSSDSGLCVSAGDVYGRPTVAVEGILEWTCKQLELEIPSSSSAELDERSVWLVERCRQVDQPVVVIIDGLDEGHPDFLQYLESYFLAPVVTEPNVLLVLSSRVPKPQGYSWKMTELRFRGEVCHLEAFNENWTEEQLRRLKNEYPVSWTKAQQVREESGGYPLSNVVLALSWKDRDEAVQKCAEALLGGVSEGLRRYFWALCVLPAFDEYVMPPMLATYLETDESTWNRQACRRILMDMVGSTRLVRWRSGKGYVMDPAVRPVLENALRQNRPDLWRELDRIASNL